MRAIVAVLVLVALTPTVVAHACYFTEGGPDACATLDPEPAVLLEALRNPLVALLLIAALAAPFVAFAAWRAGLDARVSGPWRRARDTLRSYEDLLPLTLRISLGIALAAAGSVGYLLSPLARGPVADPFLVPLQVLGYAFLFGILVRVAALATIGLYAWGIAGGVAVPHFLFGVTEILGAAVALLVLGGGRPGVDDLVERTFQVRGRVGALLAGRPGALGRASRFTPLILRVALAVTLAYGALTEKLLNPGAAMEVAESHGLTALLPASAWALLVGAVELYLALLLVVGFETRPVAVATFGVLTATMIYFGEALASHITLFGAASWLFVTGAGPLSLDRWLNPSAGQGGSRLSGVPRSVPD